MQIVIDIPEEQYKRICDHTDGVYDMVSLLTIIENGTPLPKEHGRLIDADKIEALLDLDKADNEIAKALKNIIESVPTIIEADKECD